ncbi:16S rRNA (cytosine(967)-C(5))-methyltransferase RsmB [Candidatus Macondimonas diazotrophica]|uniref:16S rRNA (cytosine(967)-C(5))-methyltransferase n=1 Tax=Candidatus Macondimonas diazotrophica TaxID=2305248 RepID=A0A4Z0F6H2_9GAMM|nr:16S rRNA (cytosine(967)-C(5))-methyltransferase RsmB [Candidatus Macondimonas diazotrophica]TFZ81842.1 16S rRNA (cytosine(967)-C(5))-methyltransferase RsmB [Candidatus Macondimonas diazotrophica]
MRAEAARVIAAVVGRGASLSTVLPPALAAVAPAERGLLQQLCYGSLRFGLRYRAVLGELMSRPLKARDVDLEALLWVGLHQIDALGMPPHAVVHATVGACRLLGKDWARGLVNGVLRNVLRDSAVLDPERMSDVQARHAHPDWLITQIRHDWPAHWEAILAANNRQAPMTLRVNARHMDRAAYAARLRDDGLESHPAPHTETGLILASPVAVDQLPGFQQGWVSVQDSAAQLAAPLLDAAPGMRVLDACAAPGGKTAHLLERTTDLDLVALDIDSARLQRVQDTLSRLGLTAEIRCADLSMPETWHDGRPFDRILLDAPCSATGVIRRHPDIKLLRRPADITNLAGRQQALLETTWNLLAPDGVLLYATCAVLRAENEAVLSAFLAGHPEAVVEPLVTTWGHLAGAGRQNLPGEDEADGFFYARLRRVSLHR